MPASWNQIASWLDHQMSVAMEHDRMMADMGMTMDMPWNAAMLSPAMTTSSARLSGGISIAAGVYQLTPFKGACLTRWRQ
jgi:predicted metal-binding membrane protein